MGKVLVPPTAAHKFPATEVRDMIFDKRRLVLLLLIVAHIGVTSGCTCSRPVPDTIENNLAKFPAAIKVWIGNEIAPDIPPCPIGTFCPGTAFRDRYWAGFVDVIYKGGEGRGKLVVKNMGFCGAGIQRRTNMLLYGSIAQETVEGYFGTVSVFTPASCASNRDWDSVGEDEQAILMALAEEN